MHANADVNMPIVVLNGNKAIEAVLMRTSPTQAPVKSSNHAAERSSIMFYKTRAVVLHLANTTQCAEICTLIQYHCF